VVVRPPFLGPFRAKNLELPNGDTVKNLFDNAGEQNGTAPTSVDSVGSGRSGRVSGLVKYLELDRGQATEGVLPASAVVGVLDPEDDRGAELVAGLPAPAV